MELITNGPPKCGNHMLVKACELLGVPASVTHLPFADGLPAGTTHHIFIKRDPRDLPISMLRWTRKQVTEGMYLSAYRDYLGTPLPEELAKYSGWLTAPNTLVVSYEAMLADDTEMRRMADYLGTPYLTGAWEELPGFTRTWIDANHANHAAIWTPQIEAAWQAEGGATIQATFGY